MVDEQRGCADSVDEARVEGRGVDLTNGPQPVAEAEWSSDGDILVPSDGSGAHRWKRCYFLPLLAAAASGATMSQRAMVISMAVG